MAVDAIPRAGRAAGPGGAGPCPRAAPARAPSAALVNSRAGGCGGSCQAGPRLKAGVRLPLHRPRPRRVLTGLVPSRDVQLSLKFKSLIFLAANPVTNRSDFVFPLLPRLDLLCLSYRTIGLRSKCYSGLIPYPGIYFDCPFSLALLIFNRSPFPVNPLSARPGSPHPVRVSIPCGSVPRSGARAATTRSPRSRGTEMRRRSGEKGLAFNWASPELPAQRLNFSPPAKPLLYPKKNSANGASGGGTRTEPGPGAGEGGGRGEREAMPPRQLRD